MELQNRFTRTFAYLASMLLATLILLFVLNAVFAAIFWAADEGQERNDPVTEKYGSTAYRSVYPDLTEEEVAAIRRESWSRTQRYEPFTQFGERPSEGTYVNVHPAGFRISKDQAPWPPRSDDFNIFVFGGSTTFGYGVPDWQTVPSFLQEYLRQHSGDQVNIYNFGRSAYISPQERALFEQLLLAGHIPDMAVFIDGLNEFAFHDGPAYTARLKALFDQQPPGEFQRILNSFALARAARYIAAKLEAVIQKDDGDSQPAVADTGAPVGDGRPLVQKVVNRYLQSKNLIEIVARGYAVRPVFVWQPVPTFRYDLDHHLFAKLKGGFDTGLNRFSGPGYAYFLDRLLAEPPGANFIWCANIQDSLAQPLYVDMVHYSADMSGYFARALGRSLIARGFVPAGPIAEGGPQAPLCRLDRSG